MSEDTLRKLRALSPKQRQQLKNRLASGGLDGFGLVAEGLQQCGIRSLSGITGTPICKIFSETASRGIRILGTRHQSPATLMAAAHNYLNGELVHAVLVSAGPAITNTVTGILHARDNQWPLLVLGGRRDLAQSGSGYFQEFNAVPMMKPLTKWAATINSPKEIIPLIKEACQIAMDGEPGPVYLDLPEDVLFSSALAVSVQKPIRNPSRRLSDEDVQRVLELLRGAKRPLLCIGEGIRWEYERDKLRHLVEREQLPFITTPMGRGFLPDTHPLCLNRLRRTIQNEVDTLLMTGAWFDWRFRLGSELSRNTQIIHVHPNKTQLGKNVNCAQALMADPGQFLSQLSEASDRSADRPDHQDWIKLTQIRCRETEDHLEDWRMKEAEPMLFQQLFRAIRKLVPEDAVIVLEGSHTLSYGQFCLDADSPLSWLDPGLNGCMGAAIPLAMAAKLAYPKRTVIAVASDTGFGLTGMDFETAVRHNLPIILVIANNDGINGHHRQNNYFPADYPDSFSRFQPQLRYDKIAGALGGQSAWITKQEQLAPALQGAIDSGLPTCLNVAIDPTAPPPDIW